MHYLHLQKTGLDDDSIDFLGWADFDPCHAGHVRKAAADPDIAGAPMSEKTASDVVHVTDEMDSLSCATNRDKFRYNKKRADASMCAYWLLIQGWMSSWMALNRHMRLKRWNYSVQGLEWAVYGY